MAELRLEELNATNIVAANNLSLKPGQEQFIAPVTYAAEASVVNPDTAWQRVALSEDRVVGFIHGNFDPENVHEEFRACIWRINVDAMNCTGTTHHFTLKIERAQSPAPETHVIANCVTEATDN